MDLNDQFYYVKDNKPVGPFSLDELLEKNLSKKTYIWTKGMSNWEKIESIPVILERINNNKNQPPVFIEPISEGNNIPQKGKGVNKIILFSFLGIIVLGLGIIGGIYFKDDLLKVTETVKVEENQIEDIAKVEENQVKDIAKVEENQVKDIDGNVYEITKIVNQYWTTKNLNVSRFRNGDEIPFVTSVEEWERAGELGKPACCCYDNAGYNCEKYGRLYNWFAVIDARGLAPEGWHVPSYNEWKILTDFLGPEWGSILKSNYYNNWNGTNEISFNVLPGGSRWGGGNFPLRNHASFWSATEYDNDNAMELFLSNNNLVVERLSYDSKTLGASVRCLRD